MQPLHEGRPSARVQREFFDAITTQLDALRRKGNEELKILRKKIRKQRKENVVLRRQVDEAVWALGLEPVNSCRRTLTAGGAAPRAPGARRRARTGDGGGVEGERRGAGSPR